MNGTDTATTTERRQRVLTAALRLPQSAPSATGKAVSGPSEAQESPIWVEARWSGMPQWRCLHPVTRVRPGGERYQTPCRMAIVRDFARFKAHLWDAHKYSIDFEEGNDGR